MRQLPDKNYFDFTKKERNGIYFLVFLLLATISASILYPILFSPPPQSGDRYANDVARLTRQPADSGKPGPFYKRNFKRARKPYPFIADRQGALFVFDPNTIGVAEWQKLGLRDRTITIIQNYLSRGGRFREPNDLKKIWGLSEDLANRIIPYARIEKESYSQTGSLLFAKSSYTPKKYHRVNVSESDTAALSQLPGIGKKLSQRIVNYREKLGGFYSVDQVAETFGLADSVFQHIKPWLTTSEASIKTININTATLEELKSHPYIRYHLANAMIQYRQHRSYTSVDQIRNIMLVDDTLYKKIYPYLTVK